MDLSDRYRLAGKSDRPYVKNELDAVAYVAFRMPATYAAMHSVMGQLRLRMPDWSPDSLLDVGAGPGTSLWAASRYWSQLRSNTLIDGDKHMAEIGRRLAARSDEEVLSSAGWRSNWFGAENSLPGSDLVVAGYVLNELPSEDLMSSVVRLWGATDGALIIVEPGTPAGFDIVRNTRRHLISLGARIVAPCPHDDRCPMAGGDWCHFSARLARSRLHLSVKPGDAGFEDEKFSYVVAIRGDGEPAPARIVRHPYYRRKMIELQLCTPSGLERAVLTRRKDSDRYRLARSASWGDEFPLDEGSS
ncbi:small ribosomal subunit Rsm22 family protein [soil metagenome]